MRSLPFVLALAFLQAGCAVTLEDTEPTVSARCDVTSTSRFCQSLMGAEVANPPRGMPRA